MTTPERTEPSAVAGERDMLEGWLDYHRATLALKCRGLDDQQLMVAAVPPSELTLLGLVRHMSYVERHWFSDVLAAEHPEPLYCGDADPDGDFHPGENDTSAEAYATWQAEISHARELAAARSLDELSEGPRREQGTGDRYTLRWIYTHMIEEYARHNGHADLLRERLDGSTGD